MIKNISFFLMLMIVCVSFLTCILPYPVFQKYSNISASDIEKINNHNEIELNIFEPNSDICVTNMNWFNSVNELFPCFAKTHIIDVQTGKSLYVFRVGGNSHAEVETIDSKNTSVLLELYNNEFNWERRSVWVEITPNIWTTGSISGYPHGTTYIENNNMNGHICLHFLGSKTHGTNRVDEGHQKQIFSAYKNRRKITKYLTKPKKVTAKAVTFCFLF